MGSLVQINTNVSVESQDPLEDNRANKGKFLSLLLAFPYSPQRLSHTTG
jgi:hypothetical protein